MYGEHIMWNGGSDMTATMLQLNEQRMVNSSNMMMLGIRQHRWMYW